MKNGFPTENTIRQYLLGRLDDQEKLENSLSQQMLFNNELSEIVDSIEEEIIEDYLDGALNAVDKRAAEEYFLRPPQRQEKLRFASLLRDHLGRPDILPEPVPRSRDREDGNVLILHLRSHLRIYSELAFLVLLTVSSLIYVAKVREGFQLQIETARKTQTQLESDLTRERELSARLARQVYELQPPLSFSWSSLRSPVKIPQVDVRAATLKIEIQGVPEQAYDARLRTKAGQQIWSQTGLLPSAGKLSFEIPARGIIADDYHLVVSSQPAHTEKSYWFHANVVK